MGVFLSISTVAILSSYFFAYEFNKVDEISDSYTQIEKEQKIQKAKELYLKLYDTYPENENDLINAELLNLSDLYVLEGISSKNNTHLTNKYFNIIEMYKKSNEFDKTDYFIFMQGSTYESLPDYIKSRFTLSEFNKINLLDTRISYDESSNKITYHNYTDEFKKEQISNLRTKYSLNNSIDEDKLNLFENKKILNKIKKMKKLKAEKALKKINNLRAIEQLKLNGKTTTVNLSDEKRNQMITSYQMVLDKTIKSFPENERDLVLNEIIVTSTPSKEDLELLVVKNERTNNNDLFEEIMTTVKISVEDIKNTILPAE